MKTCPRCKMTVDTIGVCPVCGKDILQEPDRKVRGEKYAINKYLLPYLWVKHRFSLVSAALVLLAFFVGLGRIQWQFIIPVLLSVASIVCSLFKNWFVSDELDWFEEMCAFAFINFLKFLCGGLAIFISALMVFFN